MRHRVLHVAALVVAALIASPAIAAGSSSAAKLDRQVDKARQEIVDRRLREANFTVRSILRKAPGHPEANAMFCGLLVTEADAHEQAGRGKKGLVKEWRAAAAQCGLAADLHAGQSGQESLQRLRLRSLIRAEAWTEAAALFEGLIASSPDDGRLVGGYAAMLDRAGRMEESRAALQSAASRGPEFDRAARFEFIWDRFDPSDAERLRAMIAALRAEETDAKRLAILDVLATTLTDGCIESELGFLDLVDRGALGRLELVKLWDAMACLQEGARSSVKKSGDLLTEEHLELPQLLEKPEVAYPTNALDRHLTGHVVLLSRVNLDGTVSPVWVVQATSPEFAEPAVAAALRRRYIPAKRNGEPIVIPFMIRVAFKFRY